MDYSKLAKIADSANRVKDGYQPEPKTIEASSLKQFLEKVEAELNATTSKWDLESRDDREDIDYAVNLQADINGHTLRLDLRKDEGEKRFFRDFYIDGSAVETAEENWFLGVPDENDVLDAIECSMYYEEHPELEAWKDSLAAISDSKKRKSVKDATQYPVEGTRSDRMNYVANELDKLGIHMVDGHVDHIDNPELLKIQELLKGCKRCSLSLFANDSGISAKVNIQDSLKGKVKDDKGANTEELTTLFNEIEKVSENHSMSYEENVEEFIENYTDGETYLSVYVDELEYDDDEESFDFEEDWNKNHADSGFEAYYFPIDYTTGRMYFRKK